jgi:lipopolysaccharide/colanic/teichoic acid biosynthesis glycosyltransferase
MKKDSEKNGPQWSKANDSRITKVGRFIRLTRIDELPQLFLVLRGKMSLIGPRPERPEIDKTIIEKIPNFNYRYKIKPGLSGWAQVNYPYGASINDSYIKLSYDLYYITNFSILLDLIIFLKTLKMVITLKGAIANK